MFTAPSKGTRSVTVNGPSENLGTDDADCSSLCGGTDSTPTISRTTTGVAIPGISTEEPGTPIKSTNLASSWVNIIG